jgi:hypothetical protein
MKNILKDILNIFYINVCAIITYLIIKFCLGTSTTYESCLISVLIVFVAKLMTKISKNKNL